MLRNLGLQFWNQEDYASARVYYDRALAIQEKAAPQDDRLAMLLSELGELVARLDEMTSARAHYQRAMMVYSANVRLNTRNRRGAWSEWHRYTDLPTW
jgi:tetratricopeptide (TPR) repeat protein